MGVLYVRTYVRTYHASSMSLKAVCFIRARLLASWCFGPGDDELMLNVLRCHLTY